MSPSPSELEKPERASTSSIASSSLADRAREWTRLLGMLLGDRSDGHLKDLRLSFAEHDHYANKYLGRPFTACRVLEVGFGARPNRLLWFSGMGVDVHGIDLDRPVINGSPSEFISVYRRNGVARVIKSVGRWFLNERRLRRDLLAAASKERGTQVQLQPERLVVGSAADSAFWERFHGADYVYSEDVFEHMPEEVVIEVLRQMALHIDPNGVAFIKPNIFTGICGGHQVDWYPHTLDQSIQRNTEPWEHLRQNRHPADTYLNCLSRARFRELFQHDFEILEEVCVNPTQGNHFMTPELREELDAWSDEELYSNTVIFILRKRKA